MMTEKTWDDAVDKWLTIKSHKQSLVSDIANIRWLNRILTGIPLSQIDANVVETLVKRKIACGVSNATVNRMLALLRAVLNIAVYEWDWLRKAPKIRLLSEPTRRIRYLTQREAIRLLEELPSHLAAMAAFSLATGLRRSNVTGLHWDHVDVIRRVVHFDALQMKSGRALTIPLNDDAMRVLSIRKGIHSQYVFSYKGNQIKQVSTAAWYKALKRAAIHDFRWHDLRHTWASWHIQNGTPLLALQELGGWESAEMVRRYAHFSLGNLAQYASNYPSLIRNELT